MFCVSSARSVCLLKAHIHNHQNRCPICESSLTATQEQKSHTYHPFLPDDAHTVLNARKPMRDLCEIILAHGFLFDGEWTMVRPHNI